MDYQTKQELLVAYHEARHTLEAVQRVLENVLADATIDAETVEVTTIDEQIYNLKIEPKELAVKIDQCPLAARKRSASMAAMQPLPAAVIACL